MDYYPASSLDQVISQLMQLEGNYILLDLANYFRILHGEDEFGIGDGVVGVAVEEEVMKVMKVVKEGKNYSY